MSILSNITEVLTPLLARHRTGVNIRLKLCAEAVIEHADDDVDLDNDTRPPIKNSRLKLHQKVFQLLVLKQR